MLIERILPLLIVVFIGVGCNKATGIVNSSNSFQVKQNIDASTSVTASGTAAINEFHKDEDVIVQGVLARELSQIDGIKIWTVDANQKTIKLSNSWVWIVPQPQDDPTGTTNWDGNWTFYMLNKYAGITRIQYDKLDLDNTLITVTGKRLDDDCSVVTDEGDGKCIVNIQVKNIVLGR